MIGKILSALFIFVAMLCLFTSCKSEAKKESVKTFYVEIPFNYQVNKSSIIGVESLKDSYDENSKNYFEYKDADTLNKINDKIVIIKSWGELKKIKKELKSQTLQRLTQTDFDNFDCAITLITHGDYSHLKNEKLIRKDNKVLFSYELLSVTPGPGPVSACIDMKLYILKLGK